MTEWVTLKHAMQETGLSHGQIRYRSEQDPASRRRDGSGRWLYDVSRLGAVPSQRPKNAASPSTLHSRLVAAGLAPEEPDDDGEPISDLIARRVEAFDRKDASKLPPAVVQRDLPWAVCHLGDPHLDDDGCDWPELLRTVETLKATEGYYAGCIGDVTNNWVGRLQSLHKHQTATADDAWRLAEWLITSLSWDYFQLGNHDLWNEGTTIYRLLRRETHVHALGEHECRIVYQSEGAPDTRLWARHDFPGHSMYHPSHGPLKASTFRPGDDLLICGHRHTWACHRQESHDGRAPLTLRVRGYKRHDAYAAALGHAEDTLAASLTTIHDPWAKDPIDRIRVVADPEEAAWLLSVLRERRANG